MYFILFLFISGKHMIAFYDAFLHTYLWWLWQYGLLIFQRKDTKLGRISTKSQYTSRKLLYSVRFFFLERYWLFFDTGIWLWCPWHVIRKAIWYVTNLRIFEILRNIYFDFLLQRTKLRRPTGQLAKNK